MSRSFNRVIAFHIRGEIYDTETSAEDIIKNYDWHIKNDVDGKIQVIASHKDKRGRITKVEYLPKIHPWRKPDSEFFLI